MPKRILDDFLGQFYNYPNERITIFPIASAYMCVIVAVSLRLDRDADTIVPWWWSLILLCCALALLVGSYYGLRYTALLLSVRPKPEGVYLSRRLGRLECIPWAQVKEVRGSGLSRDLLMDGLYIHFTEGWKCPLEYPKLQEHQLHWMMDTVRVIPDFIPIFPIDSPLARAREGLERGKRASAPPASWLLRLYARGEARIILPWTACSSVLLCIAFWLKSGVSMLALIFLVFAIAVSVLSSSWALYSLSGARHRTRLFFRLSRSARVARIAPEGTVELSAPFAGFRAWRPALLGRQGEVLPLTICGVGMGRRQLLRLADALPEEDAARLDIERYLTIAAVWQPIYIHSMLLICASMYVGAIGFWSDTSWLLAAGVGIGAAGLLGFAKRFWAIYQIGRRDA